MAHQRRRTLKKQTLPAISAAGRQCFITKLNIFRLILKKIYYLCNSINNIKQKND